MSEDIRKKLPELERQVARLTRLIKAEKDPHVRYVMINKRNSAGTLAHLIRNNGRVI